MRLLQVVQELQIGDTSNSTGCPDRPCKYRDNPLLVWSVSFSSPRGYWHFRGLAESRESLGRVFRRPQPETNRIRLWDDISPTLSGPYTNGQFANRSRRSRI